MPDEEINVEGTENEAVETIVNTEDTIEKTDEEIAEEGTETTTDEVADTIEGTED